MADLFLNKLNNIQPHGQAIHKISCEHIHEGFGTDTSNKQLELLQSSPSSLHLYFPNISPSELNRSVESSVDLVTVAQALHWFDNESFYDQVKWILKKPNGVIAAWCYTIPEIDDQFDPFSESSTRNRNLIGLLRGLG
ncbi:hypothetical protein OSB04_020612 [Centaurea solstitialis]|uniref:Methyltransferase type 11 domain-containing protein n=1 Tax=Centaurea solstitialis TaxID=347529 RepID=A0AA38SSK6_9ASTR|nr:hypothetical protein OSB04_020612 [Centaurea solstitialis]